MECVKSQAADPLYFFCLPFEKRSLQINIFFSIPFIIKICYTKNSLVPVCLTGVFAQHTQKWRVYEKDRPVDRMETDDVFSDQM
jgi:hypothetical protein